MEDNELSQLLDCINIFRHLYDHIRFVDPVNSSIINLNSENKLDEKVEELKCYNFWGVNKTCKNCISMLAFVENKLFLRIETRSDRIYLTMAVPLALENRKIIIELIKDATDSIFFENSISCNFLEVLKKIEKINNLALKDALTGVYNRRYINEKLPIDLMTTAASNISLSVIMVDIDHYKLVNDTYGHLVGDTVLKILAETIQSCIKRETDWVARYGGEEFFICLPGAQLPKALEIAENIRKTIEGRVIKIGTEEIRVTASFGVSSNKYTKDSNFEDVIDQADRKLYKAKGNGRNRIEW